MKKNNINDLKNDRGEIAKKMKALNKKALDESRDFTEEEQTEWDDYKKELKSLENRIERLSEIEEQERQTARFAPAVDGGEQKPEEKEKKKITKSYSFLKAIRTQGFGQKLDGLELEMHQEAEVEARGSGINISGLGIPSFFLSAGKRDLTVTTEGGDVVQTDVQGVIPALRPKLMTEKLGATVLSGLTGNLKISRNNGVGAAAWEGENDSNAETTQTLDAIDFTPQRLGAFTDLSKQLIFQTSWSVEQFVRKDLEMAIAIAVDAAAINGNGGNIDGILGASGIGIVVGGTDGAAPDHADIIDLETAVAVDNADEGNLAYLTTPGVRGVLKKTKVDAGSGIFIWPASSKELNGYSAEVSTQVPSNLTKGSGTNLHAIIYGNWRELLIGNWAGLDLLVNPYTKGKEALVEVIANSWWDADLRHNESFAAMKDVIVS